MFSVNKETPNSKRQKGTTQEPKNKANGDAGDTGRIGIASEIWLRAQDSSSSMNFSTSKSLKFQVYSLLLEFNIKA